MVGSPNKPFDPRTKPIEMESTHRHRMFLLTTLLQLLRYLDKSGQLVEQLLPTPDVRGSNHPVIGKIYIELLLSTALRRRK